ncbi:MAG: FtsB family cell division protein [Pseudomonadota bacterium]
MDNARLIRLLTLAALAITLVLQVTLWFGDGSLMHIHQLKKQIATQQDELAKLKARNEILEAQVRSLKENVDSVEGLARGDLGMIRQGETFFLVTDPGQDKPAPGEETAP